MLLPIVPFEQEVRNRKIAYYPGHMVIVHVERERKEENRGKKGRVFTGKFAKFCLIIDYYP